MLVVLLGVSAKDNDVVYICKTEIQVFQNLVHETLEGLGGVSQTKGHIGKFESPKGVVIPVFWMSSRWTGIWWYALTRSILEKVVQPDRR